MKSIGQKGKRAMRGQEEVKDNTSLAYFLKQAIISAGIVVLQAGTSENDASVNKWNC